MAGVFDMFSTDDPQKAAKMALIAGLLGGKGSFNSVVGQAMNSSQKAFQLNRAAQQEAELKQAELSDIKRKAEDQQRQKQLLEQFKSLIPSPESEAITANTAAMNDAGGFKNALSVTPQVPDKNAVFLDKAMRADLISPIDLFKSRQKDTTPIMVPQGGMLSTPAGKMILENKPEFKPSDGSPEEKLLAARDRLPVGSEAWNLFNNILKKKGDWKPEQGGGGLPAEIDPATKKKIDFYATQELAGMKDWRSNFRGKDAQKVIALVLDRVPTMAAELGISPQDVGTNRANNRALTATLQDLTKRSEAVDLFASKVEKDMATLDNLLDKASTGSPMLISKPINALRRQFSDPELAQLDLAAKQVGTEYERLITGGTLSIAQLHVGAQEDAKKLINGDMTPKQARAVMQTMKQEIANARAAAADSLKRVKGHISGLGTGTATSDKVVDFGSLK